MDRLFLILTLACLVVGCDTPSPVYLGGVVREVAVDDSRFRVYMQHGAREVETHRISIEPLPSMVETLERAFRAIEIATGCHVVPGSLVGDQAIILAEVDCLLL